MNKPKSKKIELSEKSERDAAPIIIAKNPKGIRSELIAMLPERDRMHPMFTQPRGEPLVLNLPGIAGTVELSDLQLLEFVSQHVYEIRQKLIEIIFNSPDAKKRLGLAQSLLILETVHAMAGNATDIDFADGKTPAQDVAEIMGLSVQREPSEALKWFNKQHAVEKI